MLLVAGFPLRELYIVIAIDRSRHRLTYVLFSNDFTSWNVEHVDEDRVIVE